MRELRRLGAILGLAIAATLGLADVALADHVRALCHVTVTSSAKLEQGYVLSATVTTADGRPVNEATVRFYELVEFAGPREMLIATATTDGQGKASTTYLPASTGVREILVRFPGREHVLAASDRTTFDATVAAPPYRVEAPALSAFSAAVPYGVAVVVLSVWSVIAFALLATARGVLRGARDRAGKGDIA